MLSLAEEKSDDQRFIFVNLVDTDMLFGHRRDAVGYAKEVGTIDISLGKLIDSFEEGDLLIITGDHGCDPTHRGTDHTREHVPLLWYEKGKDIENYGVLESFSDMSQSICSYFGVPKMKHGKSFR